MRIHNSNILLLFIISTLLFTISCAKNSTSPSTLAQKKPPPIVSARKLSPIELYMNNFMETVRQYWAYASSTDEQMDCTVDIEISPDGEIVSYKLMKSSGNKYFDSSAQNAIVRTQKSGVRLPPPEPLPKGMTIIFDLPPKNAR